MKICLSCSARFSDSGWRCPACFFTPEEVDGFLSFAPAQAKSSEGVQPNHFSELAQAEAEHFWFRSRNRLIIWALRHFFPGARNFLEIGCGTEYVLSGVADANPHLEMSGSEIHSDGLGYAANRVKEATLFQMDARKIPFEDEFDVVGHLTSLNTLKRMKEFWHKCFKRYLLMEA